MIVWSLGGTAWILLVFLTFGLCRTAGAGGCGRAPGTTSAQRRGAKRSLSLPPRKDG
jgi:hypothetical protein